MDVKISKEELLKSIIDYYQNDVAALKKATASAVDAATNEESMAEHEYDTRSIEAGYLAGAQSKRLSEVEKLLNSYKTLKCKTFTDQDEIELTALVECESDGKFHYYFLSPFEGGKTFKVNGTDVNIISPRSPLGEELMGRKVEDIFDIETPHGLKSFFIVSIA